MPKYPYKFVLETQHGYYPHGKLGYAAAYRNLSKAVAQCNAWIVTGTPYRVVDGDGNVIYEQSKCDEED